MLFHLVYNLVDLLLLFLLFLLLFLLFFMQFLLQHAQSTRFVQFPGITLKSGMQDREVRIV